METTHQLVGMKAFRQNMASYANRARKLKKSFIVLRKNVPVFEVKPVDEKKLALQKLIEETKVSREQVKRGQVFTPEEVDRILGF